MRASGILLAVSSLPSKYGIGCFSKEAYEFVDQLKEAGQSYWQILPLGPIGYGDSPYQSFSTFAGNPYYISLERLISYGWLTEEECQSVDFGDCEQFIDYGKLYEGRYELLRKAFVRSNIIEAEAFTQFVEKEKAWLEDYAMFMALKNSYGGKCWSEWEEEIKFRNPDALAEKAQQLKDDILFYEFLQFEFSRQWHDLKAYVNAQGIKIIGDIPIYVSFDSADAWAQKELFQFNENGERKAVAGCPPDGFSAVGQLWGNPLYQWDYHRETGYDWWMKRLGACYEMYDVVRIDHFRGFDEYYSIPYGAQTAIDGHWEKGPGMELFHKVASVFPGKEIIAEDLGYVTDSVRQLVLDSGYPGMKVLEFAFDSRDSGSAADYLPHNYPRNSVVYTGTHDNETVIGWFANGLQDNERAMVRDYLCDHFTPDDQMHIPMICAAMRSVAKLCIIPMQDYFGYGNEARMNTPSTSGSNWKWRMKNGEFSHKVIAKMFSITKRYGR
jgi:4-alpha-glucanotransferase